ncbi:hypothetical protein E5Q_02391 [Mixia osmundae IAM 14324]|uniref:Uncharacterized protein n=1 Tax=Mixia osmundae (strain CBS 9802 / IAM 14324 / JCM 22182 / KY 12970) TaxID=764103 RepID=G7DYS4_MIXOS|nr:hypothetical protein E5Q_02391 [Mixia osmundae IAM 14324]
MVPGPNNAGDSASVQVETHHEDMIHDAQLDFHGKRLATASSDRTVKVFDVTPNGQYALVDTLRGHDGPVWQIAWAHPKFGGILASASYDGKVFVWRESPAPSQPAQSAQGYGYQAGPYGHQAQAGLGSWSKIKEHTLHNASVNSISWAPHELGPILACASSDGKVSVLTFNNDGTWDASLFVAHLIGCNAVSWAPATMPGSLIQPQSAALAPQAQNGQAGPGGVSSVRRFASGGCDGFVKIWGWRDDTKTWAEEEVLEGHTDWVRDVAWAPNIGMPKSYLASAGQDKQVFIHIQDRPGAPWTRTQLDPSTAAGATSTIPGQFADVVWRVSWSIAGQVLAVSGGDGVVTLWKESLKGSWECVSDVKA